MPLPIRNQYESVREEYPGSLAAVTAGALMCASCIRVNDAYISCLHLKCLQKLDFLFSSVNVTVGYLSFLCI